VDSQKAYAPSHSVSSLFITDLQLHSGFRQKRSYMRHLIRLVFARVFILLNTTGSAIIQGIKRISEAGLAHMAYFFFNISYFPFIRPCPAQQPIGFSLQNPSLIFSSTHQRRGSQRLSGSALMQCLERPPAPGDLPEAV
jgi:hypothetical protein